MGKGLKDEGLNVDSLEDPGTRYDLGEIIGRGVNATVYRATDSQSGGKQVAIKIQIFTDGSQADIVEEYRIFRDLSDHPNLPDFYGVYKKVNENGTVQIWFVMQLCKGGPATDVVRAIIRQNKRMDEIHIAFILREVIKALIALHENRVMHRDVKANNILLTEAGEVKLVDFGLSRELDNTLGKRKTSLGDPCWMAPEVVTSEGDKTEYDNRTDVWSLGITAIELGEGKAPFQDMHPTRALFQIVRNPPPTLYRPANWSQNYNDFIAECLTKNPEHRPYMMELLEHPFFSIIPANDLHLNAELKILLESITDEDRAGRAKEVTMKSGLVKENQESKPEPLFVEDVAALEVHSEENILHHIESRYKKGMYYTFIGEVLLFLNPNRPLDIFRHQFNNKYKFKSRSENEPHIYSVADSAFQNMLHHGVPQHITLTGETMSGKTTQFRHLIRHLLFLAKLSNKTDEKILKAVDIIHAFGNAATPLNSDSTRHILLTQLTFSRSGKTSGIIFWLYQLEKWRVTGNRNPHHANFHIFYYLYHGMAAKGLLEKYQLEPSRSYCYLRLNIDDNDKDPKCPAGPREIVETSAEKFIKISQYLADLQIEESQIEVIWKTLAAILLLGEVDYKDDDDGNADIKNEDVVEKVATLLGIESKKLCWVLCNYCVVEKDTAARRRHSKAEALEARNVLSRTLYSRLVDWIINIINLKFSFSRAVYGDYNCITLLDLFGFECYEENGIEQLFVNAVNEQFQYFYNQKIFISEMHEMEEERLPITKFNFYDNRTTMDELLNKPLGIIHLMDEGNRLHQDSNFLINSLNKKAEGANIKACNEEEFSVAHYTGKVTYCASAMVSKNRDFLPPEITEVMRFSREDIIKQIFTNKMSRTGNVTLLVDKTSAISENVGKKRWGTALLNDSKRNIRRFNTASRGEFSQTRGIRTAAAVFKAISLELLRVLTEGGTHFVRCVRTDLTGTPEGFQPNIVRHQLRALSVADTARAKLVGYSYRIPFEQFLERYQFLAFDFDENVEQTKENCRLLLIRLKMEGWFLGKTKVYLKYYNEEYLSRLYETQVKKIVKVQSMLRAFLAKRSVQHKKGFKSEPSNTEIATSRPFKSKDEAAVIIQKHLKGYVIRKLYGPLIHPESGKMNEETAVFIKPYFKKWNTRSLYQILVQYKAARHMDLVYFCQQVHLYNQNTVSSLRICDQENIDLKKIQTNMDAKKFIGEELPAVWKIPFNIKDLPLCDSSLLCESMDMRFVRTKDIPWDDPFKCLDKGCQTLISINEDLCDLSQEQNHFTSFIGIPYCRDPNQAEVEYGKQLPDDELILPDKEEETAEKAQQFIETSDNELILPDKEEEIAEGAQQFIETSDKELILPDKKEEIAEGAQQFIETLQLEKSIKVETKEPKDTIVKEQKELPEVDDEDQDKNANEVTEKPNETSEVIVDTDNTTSKNQNSIPISSSPIKEKETPKKEMNIVKSSPLKLKLVSPLKTPLTERKEFMKPTIDENREIIDFRKNLRPIKIGKKSDPILELETKGKEITRRNSQNEDDPPFNFQAMLRKTNYQESPRKDTKTNTELDSAFKRRSFKRRTSSTKENDEPENMENISNKSSPIKFESPKMKIENSMNSRKNIDADNKNIIDNNNKESFKSSNNVNDQVIMLNGRNLTETIPCTSNQKESKQIGNKKDASNVENNKKPSTVVNNKEASNVVSTKEANNVVNKKEDYIVNKKEASSVENNKEACNLVSNKEASNVEISKEASKVVMNKDTSNVMNNIEASNVENNNKASKVVNNKEASNEGNNKEASNVENNEPSKLVINKDTSNVMNNIEASNVENNNKASKVENNKEASNEVNNKEASNVLNKKEVSNIEAINYNNIQNATPTSDKRKGFLRKDSFESIKLVLSATKDFRSTPPIMENGNLDSSDDIITTELVPGLIITGKITEL